jgi:uncharacterized OB-fold protein
MVATALERAGASATAASEAVTVTQVGGTVRLDAGALEAMLGVPVALLPDEPGRRSLGGAMGQAERGPGAQWVVVAATRGAGPSGPLPDPPGEGAAALLFDDRPGAIPVGPPRSNGTSGSSERALAELFELAASRARANEWTGDWRADPATGPPPPARSPVEVAPVASVSQGAFVPGPRYEESRPSRWRFVADRCGACGARTFPMRGRCRGCGRSDRLVPEALPLGGASVLAATWIGPGGQPTEFDPVVETGGPYGVVLAEVVPGVRVTLAVTDARPEEVRVGATVDTVLRRLYPIEGAWRYGRKAVPAGGDGRARRA